MTNPFTRPRTTGEWLLSSSCWMASCCGSWWASTQIVLHWYGEDGLVYLSPIAFLATNCLLLRYGVLRGWRVVGLHDAGLPTWLKITSYLWFSLLAGFQLLCLLFLLFLLTWL